MPDLTISGVDVSHHQGEVDFKAAYDSGQRFAYVKATEGRDYFDPRFEANWAVSSFAFSSLLGLKSSARMLPEMSRQ